MTDADIDHPLPRTITLLFPDSYKVTIPRRLRIFDVAFEFPWTSSKSHITRYRHLRVIRLPGEQWSFVGRGNGMIEHPLLTVNRSRSKQKTVVRDVRHERFARSLLFSHLRKRLLSLDHVLQWPFLLRTHRKDEKHRKY